MKLKKKQENYFLIGVSLLIIFSFFLGFFLNENSAGGGGFNGDFGNYIWPNLNLFKENIFININSYNYTDSRMPTSYILHVLFNPFINTELQFRISTFFVSILCPIFFFLNLRLKYKNFNTNLLLFLTCLLLLSPYFRTTAYWGLQENYGILCILISFYAYQKYFIVLKYKTGKTQFLTLFFLSFFSSLSFYFDQKLLIIPFIFFILLVFDNKISIISKITLIIYYTLMSIPALYLILLWKGILPPNAMGARKTGTQLNFYNLGYASTIIFFYSIPFLLLINNLKEKFSFFIKKKSNNYLIIFITYLFILLLYGNFNDLGTVGQGIFHKLINFIFFDKLVQHVITILVFLLSWMMINLFIENFNNKFIAKLFFYYLIFISLFIYPIFQEYFDPLILIVMFTFLNFNIFINFKNILVLFFYFTFFLIFTNLYYLQIVKI